MEKYFLEFRKLEIEENNKEVFGVKKDIIEKYCCDDKHINEKHICENCGMIHKIKIYEDNDFIRNKTYIRLNYFKSKLNISKKYTKKHIELIKNKYPNSDYKDLNLIVLEMDFKFLYKDLNRLYFDLMNYNFNEYRLTIINSFERIENAYIRLNKYQRKNMLNYRYVIAQILRHLNFYSFSCIIDKYKLEEYNLIFREICKLLNWKFVEIE